MLKGYIKLIAEIRARQQKGDLQTHKNMGFWLCVIMIHRMYQLLTLKYI